MVDAQLDSAYQILTLDNGARVRLRALALELIASVRTTVEARWLTRGQWIVECPVYTATPVAGGVTFTFTMKIDECAIETYEECGGVDMEHQHSLEARRQAGETEAAFERERVELLIRLCVREAVEVVTGPSMAAWVRRRMGRTIPTDVDDRKIAYVLEYVITTPRDVQSILRGVLELSNPAHNSVLVREAPIAADTGTTALEQQ